MYLSDKLLQGSSILIKLRFCVVDLNSFRWSLSCIPRAHDVM
uniref:Uncharacterized protein n=1 Tax=Arundo donax TaxID=35708 RepID=A0A0A9DBC6_ARUDO